MTATNQSTDVLIVGAGVGGIAAAIAVLQRGLTVIMTDEYQWIGGQLTVQGTPPDEHPWIETIGGTANYGAFRQALRQYYHDSFQLTPKALADPLLNPGNATVTKIAASPDVSEAVLQRILSRWVDSGALRMMTRTRVVGAEIRGDAVGALEFDTDGTRFTVNAPYIIDATETGDVIAEAGIEHVTGAESSDETGEPHAPAVSAPLNMQAFSWTFALGYDPREDHTIPKPEGYDHWKQYRPDFWPDNFLSFTYPDPRTLEPIEAEFAPHTDGPEDLLVADQSQDPGSRNLWVYRRTLWRHHFANGSQPSDITIVNWPMTDYAEGPLYGETAADAARHMKGARDLSLSYLYWLQTEAPRPDGGTGWAGLVLRPDVMGTDDGLAMGPYVRESRRIRALRTVVEQEISLAVRGDKGAVIYEDSVGIGAYRIDLHPSTAGDNYIDIACAPFQIPLGSLVPQRVTNVLPAAKNLGTTHITNGCYRVHPAEWSIGEASGALAAFCIGRKTTPHAVATSADLTHEFQQDLVRAGIALAWPNWVRGY